MIARRADTETIRADFDRIALLSADEASLGVYHKFLLKQIPARCVSALEVGCGTGEFSRLLAGRSERVTAIDLSPKMIEVARRRSTGFRNIDFLVTDALTWEMPAEHFDCIASIATLHHLPQREMLLKMREALKPGGTLIILDLVQSEGIKDLITSAIAAPVSVSMRLVRTGRLRPRREVRRAWDEHALGDSYLTMAQARQLCDDVLPGARVRKHLLWRYSIVWRKELRK